MSNNSRIKQRVLIFSAVLLVLMTALVLVVLYNDEERPASNPVR